MRRSLYALETKIAFGMIAITIILFGLSITYHPQSPVRQFIGIISFELLESLLNVGTLFIIIYPAYVLKKISPKVSNLFDAPKITHFLPSSKKRLYWDGIKGWLILAPILITITLILYLLAKYQIDNSSFNYHFQLTLQAYDFEKIMEIINEELPFYVMQIIFVGALVLVFIANTIIHFSRHMSKSKYVTLNMITFTIVLVSALYGYSRFEMYHEGIWLISLYLVLIGYFIYAFKKIEFIYQ